MKIKVGDNVKGFYGSVGETIEGRVTDVDKNSVEIKYMFWIESSQIISVNDVKCDGVICD
jgi:hypothetical protein